MHPQLRLQTSPVNTGQTRLRRCNHFYPRANPAPPRDSPPGRAVRAEFLKNRSAGARSISPRARPTRPARVSGRPGRRGLEDETRRDDARRDRSARRGGVCCARDPPAGPRGHFRRGCSRARSPPPRQPEVSATCLGEAGVGEGGRCDIRAGGWENCTFGETLFIHNSATDGGFRWAPSPVGVERSSHDDAGSLIDGLSGRVCSAFLCSCWESFFC